jgi:flagellar protein FlgJ|tara:strand:+ start:1176 stop:1484 length:309 start_codon:yes stop_codon:yes gene_type:complete
MGIDLQASFDVSVANFAAEQSAFAKPDHNSDLQEVAEQFEAIFLNELLKQARKAKLAEDIFGNSAKETYEGMLDREMSVHLSKQVNLGIADALVRQFGDKGK